MDVHRRSHDSKRRCCLRYHLQCRLWLQLGSHPLALPSRGLRFLDIAPKRIISCSCQILPLTVRAKGVSLSTATNWAFNFLVGEGTPLLQDVIGWRLYPMHGFFCACSFVLVYFRKYACFLPGVPVLIRL